MSSRNGRPCESIVGGRQKPDGDGKGKTSTGRIQVAVADLAPGKELTDTSLANFAGLDELLYLVRLSGAPISDAAPKHLERCQNLTFLSIDKTGASAGGLAALRKALSQLKIQVAESIRAGGDSAPLPLVAHLWGE